MNHFIVTDNSDNIVAQNLESECRECLSNCNTKGGLIEPCPIYKTKRRQGILENNNGTTFLCCATTKTTKLFREKLNALSYSYHDLVLPKEQLETNIRKSEQQKVNRLVHNLTSINAHNIQEIYDFVPQEILSANWREQIEYIEKELTSNLNKAALMILRISKHNIHMKSEFSIYRKLDRNDNAELDFQIYPLRNVLLNVLHTFFGDFTANSIYVKVADYFKKVAIDYETVQVAFYHLIENASKYAKPNSEIDITFNEDKDFIFMNLIMPSLLISPEEKDKIFDEGFSGSLAKKLNKSGDGIGMWRIRQMIELNLGEFTLICGEEIENYRGIEFAENKFIVKLRKNMP